MLTKVFLLATKKISKSKIPLIHQVIPIFDIITTALEDNINKHMLPPVVRHAALQGYLMLNKYYSLTDESVVYQIAMSALFIYFLALLTFYFLLFYSSTSPLQGKLLHSCKMAQAVDYWCQESSQTEKYKKAMPPAVSQPEHEDHDANHVHMYRYWLILNLSNIICGL